MRMLVPIVCLMTSVILSSLTFAADDTDRPQPGEERSLSEQVVVEAREDDLTGIATSATDGATGAVDLAKRPILRSGEVVETIPGIIATQHSGGGKGNQFFLRGFNLDHGTDFRINVDGMQVNLPTHGHGQGYADLSFLIPELIETVQFRKGLYRASDGDFASAGATDIRLVNSLPRTSVIASLGGNEFQRALLADSTEFAGGEVLGGFEYYHYDGPWERPDDFRKLNGPAALFARRCGSADGRSRRWATTAAGIRPIRSRCARRDRRFRASV